MAGSVQLSMGLGDEVVAGYRGPAVCKIVGVTYRRLDYWARTGVCTPSLQQAAGSGTVRLYSFQDLVLLRVIKRLIDTGVSLQKIRTALEFFEQTPDLDPAQVTLASDGTSVFALTDRDEVFDALRNGQGMFAIAIGPVMSQLEGEVAGLPSDRAQVPDTDRVVQLARHAS